MQYFVKNLRRLAKACDSWTVLVILTASLGTNLYLALDHRNHPVLSVPSLTVGGRITDLTVETMKGNKSRLSWNVERRPVVLYVFSPSCIWCKRNLENIRSLAGMRKQDYRFVGLSISSVGLQDYAKRADLGFPIFQNAELMNGEKFIVRSTPETAIISPSGKVEEVWSGAYMGSVKAKVEERMRLRLPGLQMAD